RLGGLEVDDQLKSCDLLHGEVGRLLAFENAPSVDAEQTVGIGKTRAVTNKSAGRPLLEIGIHGRDSVAGRQRDKLTGLADEEQVATDQQCSGLLLDKSRDGGVDFAGLLAFRTSRFKPRERAACCTSFISGSAKPGFVGLTR